MYRNYKVVPFIPAGRKKTMDILLKYFRLHSDIIDEVQIWYNPKPENTDDQAWLKSLDSDFLKAKYLPEHYQYIPKPIQFNTGRFYEYTTDENTIYVRFDDDIIYMHDDFLKNILDFRIDHPEYFVVFATMWNNAVVSFIEQQEGRIDRENGIVSSPYCMDEIGWGNGPFAIHIHEKMLEAINSNNVEQFYMNGTASHPNLKWMGAGYELLDRTRFSISCFCFFGKDFKVFNGVLPEPEAGKMDEEVWITEHAPVIYGRNNVICSNAIVSHYTFSPFQSPYVNETDILERYRAIAEKKLSSNYYKLLTTE